MKVKNSNPKDKQNALRANVVARFGSIAAFAIEFDLNYNRLVGTISGRDPDLACATILIRELNLTPDDFPRLPRSWPIEPAAKPIPEASTGGHDNGEN